MFASVVYGCKGTEGGGYGHYTILRECCTIIEPLIKDSTFFYTFSGINTKQIRSFATERV